MVSFRSGTWVGAKVAVTHSYVPPREASALLTPGLAPVETTATNKTPTLSFPNMGANSIDISKK